MLHDNGFVVISIPLTETAVKCTGAVKIGESAMPNIQLVRIWITLQSFNMGKENISRTLVLKGE